MSLINKMLQELDARRSDSAGASPFGQQVRAVPDRHKVHPAWWAVIALALVLVSVLSWLWLQPARPVNVSPSQLPLKLDLDLNIENPVVASPQQVPADVASTGDAKPAEKTAVAEAMTTPVVNAPVLEALAPPPVPAMAAETLGVRPRTMDEAKPARDFKKQPLADKKSPDASDRKMAENVSATEPVKTVTPARSNASPPARQADMSAPLPSASPSSAPLPVNKQVKELSTQQRAENEYRKAVLAMKQGKATEAIGGLELALQLDAYHAAARQALVGMMLEQNRQDDAIRSAKDGLQLDASQVGLATILARLQVEKGDPKPAIETLERSLPYAADRADYQAFLAALLQREGRHKQATEHYLFALQRSPQNGVWWMGMGISLQAEHRNPEAAEAFRRAKTTNSLSPELASFVDGRLAQLQR